MNKAVRAKEANVKILGPVPLRIKNERQVDKAYAAARKDIQAIRQAAAVRRAKTG